MGLVWAVRTLAWRVLLSFFQKTADWLSQMLLGKKRDLLAEKDKSGTPKASRKVVPFDKCDVFLLFCFLTPWRRYVTAKDQIELVEKDMAGGFKFSVVRHRLSGGEQRGTLIVGVTALSFLNTKEKIVFCHPYRVITSYRVNAKGQLEYSVEIDKGKTLVYLFDTAEAASVVTAIDRSSLRLEKVMAASAGGSKSPRPGGAPSAAQPAAAPLVDAEGKHAAAAGNAPVVAPKTKIAEIGGMRFNVRIARGDAVQRVVAILNEDGMILVDPSAESKVGHKKEKRLFPLSSVSFPGLLGNAVNGVSALPLARRHLHYRQREERHDCHGGRQHGHSDARRALAAGGNQSTGRVMRFLCLFADVAQGWKLQNRDWLRRD